MAKSPHAGVGCSGPFAFRSPPPTPSCAPVCRARVRPVQLPRGSLDVMSLHDAGRRLKWFGGAWADYSVPSCKTYLWCGWPPVQSAPIPRPACGPPRNCRLACGWAAKVCLQPYQQLIVSVPRSSAGHPRGSQDWIRRRSSASSLGGSSLRVAAASRCYRCGATSRTRQPPSRDTAGTLPGLLSRIERRACRTMGGPRRADMAGQGLHRSPTTVTRSIPT